MHCMTVSLASGGAGLGAVWGFEKAKAMLAEAGFGRIEVLELAAAAELHLRVPEVDRRVATGRVGDL